MGVCKYLVSYFVILELIKSYLYVISEQKKREATTPLFYRNVKNVSMF